MHRKGVSQKKLILMVPEEMYSDVQQRALDLQFPSLAEYIRKLIRDDLASSKTPGISNPATP